MFDIQFNFKKQKIKKNMLNLHLDVGNHSHDLRVMFYTKRVKYL